MTEPEWLGCDNPEPMIAFLTGQLSGRQWRLFACASLREVGHLLPQPRARGAFLALQRFADGQAGFDELRAAHREAVAALRHLESAAYPRSSLDRRLFRRMVGVHEALVQATLPGTAMTVLPLLLCNVLARADLGDRAWTARVHRTACELLRDIAGNPFRRLFLPGAWLDEKARQARGIARVIYAERSFDELGVLADALEDAGCPCEPLVAHCREARPHGRGCWAVDLLREGDS